ncbi:MAG: M28 family peptidase, partial [Anaerolineae bacterium]|nr:M28 family peptidase [Anaerolineae bacterium]
ADDNASAIAVQLETARHLQALKHTEEMDLAVRFVSFALEEPPVYGTRYTKGQPLFRMARTWV